MSSKDSSGDSPRRQRTARTPHARRIPPWFGPLEGRLLRRRSKTLTPCIEGLENRALLSTITWNTTAAPTGGDWDTGANWTGNVIPGPNDIAVISLTSAGTVTHSTATADAVKSL